jgi:hypothetical protein
VDEGEGLQKKVQKISPSVIVGLTHQDIPDNNFEYKNPSTVEASDGSKSTMI